MPFWAIACGFVAGGIAAVVGLTGLAPPAVEWAGLAVMALCGGVALVERKAGQQAGSSRQAEQTLAIAAEGWFLSDRAMEGPAFVNAAYRRMVGDTPPEELLRRAAEDDENAARMLSEVASGRNVMGEVSFADERGGRRWISLRADPLVDDGGLMAWRIQDATVRRAAEATTIEQLFGLEAVLDGIPIGIFGADDTSRVVYANTAFCQLIGRPVEALADSVVRIDDLFAPNEASPQEQVPPRPDGAEHAVLRNGSDAGGHPVLLHRTDAAGALVSGLPLSEIGVVAPMEERAVAAAEEPGDDQFQGLFQHSPIGIAVIDDGGKIVAGNTAFDRFLGLAPGQSVGRQIEDAANASDHDDTWAALQSIAAPDGNGLPIEVRIMAPDRERVAAIYASRISSGDGRLLLYVIDTTDQKVLELQFAQAQKMQAVGQLAGGIAHDFNNLLTAIIGFCDLLLMRHQAGDHSFSDIMQVKQNANRAANLVRQLLAFSRQQTLKPEVLSVTDVLAELSNLLRRLIGESIELNVVHARDVAYIKADQGQLEQVIINLSVNARDAMGGGGALTIRTSNVTRSQSMRMGHELLPAGEYVFIEVQDTGVGISKEDLGKIFEPFFTTKDVGAGTGLGLSTVYGIVKQFDGYVFVDSKPGEGTVFKIFLPQHEADAPARPRVEAEDEQHQRRDLTGHGTILLVEDEDAVRMFGARALRNKGCTVLEADSGESALELLKSAEQTIDLLVTDVVMPRMDGPTLAEHVRNNRPDIKVIYISGYAEDAFRSQVDETINFLPKPFSLGQLAAKVKGVLQTTEA